MEIAWTVNASRGSVSQELACEMDNARRVTPTSQIVAWTAKFAMIAMLKAALTPHRRFVLLECAWIPLANQAVA
jgi:hypothetical protein